MFLWRYRSSLLNSIGTNGGPSLGASLQSEASMPRRSQDSVIASTMRYKGRHATLDNSGAGHLPSYLGR